MSFPNPTARCQCGGPLRVFTADTAYHRNMKFRKCRYHDQGSNHHFEWADGHVCSPVCQPRMRGTTSTSRDSSNTPTSSPSPLPSDDSPTTVRYEAYAAELLQIIHDVRLENTKLQEQLIHRDEVISQFSLSNATLRVEVAQLKEGKGVSDAKFIILLAILAVWLVFVFLF